MMRRRNLITSLAALSLAPYSRAQSERSIVLGQSVPLSGASEQLGVQYNMGARLFFDALNASGGINGRTIDLRRMDDGYDPDRCVANTKQFISDGVFALFGYVGTPTTLAALPLATAAKIPLFAPLTGAQSLREPYNRYIVHLRASYNDETAAIIRHSTALGIKKIGVFYQNDSYGQAGLDGITRAMAPLSLKPVSTGTVERGSSDVAKAVKDILAAQPEAIVQVGSYKACATFVRMARQAGFTGNFFNISFVGTQALLEDLGAMARGVMVSQVMPYPYSASTPLAGEYLAAMQAAGLRAPPSYSSMEGFVAAKVFAEGLRRAGRNATRESFLGAMYDMQNLNLNGLTLSFSPQRNTGSTFVEMTMLTEDGRVRK